MAWLLDQGERGHKAETDSNLKYELFLDPLWKVSLHQDCVGEFSARAFDNRSLVELDEDSGREDRDHETWLGKKDCIHDLVKIQASSSSS